MPETTARERAYSLLTCPGRFSKLQERDVCVELPEEAIEEGESAADVVSQLMASLYGTSDASANWQEEVNKSMKQWGSEMGKRNPCTYFYAKRKLRCLVHGDGFVCAGGVEDLKLCKARLQERFEIKRATVGTDEAAGEIREARILNRIIRVTEDGSEYEADQRHADLVVKETGADDKSSLTHPGGGKQVMAVEAETEALMGAEATRFRVVAARASYLSGDRPDIQYEVKEICRRMAKPVRGDWEKPVRLGRYLKGAPRCVKCYGWQGDGAARTGCSDSDLAGCRTTGKSTSGGIGQLGSRLIKSWSRTQDSVTLS